MAKINWQNYFLSFSAKFFFYSSTLRKGVGSKGWSLTKQLFSVIYQIIIRLCKLHPKLLGAIVRKPSTNLNFEIKTNYGFFFMDTNDLKDSTSCWDVTLILLYPPQLLSNIASYSHVFTRFHNKIYSPLRCSIWTQVD